MNMLWHSLKLFILMLIWMTPNLETWARFGLNAPRISMVFLLGWKNVCLGHKWNSWALNLFLYNWVANVENLRFLVHALGWVVGFVTGIRVGVGCC
jgi:glucose-6-phosphate-specific signal transduction histidine kinase